MTNALDERTRELALACLASFCARVLPGTVRRIAAWKRLPRFVQGELRGELQQELAVDALAHAAEVLALPPAARHARWMRLAERFVYRHYVAVPLLQDVEPPPAAAAPPDEPALPVAEPSVDTMQNGRLNVKRTAARRGVGERGLRRQLDAVAERLGAGEAHVRFWRARLAEALTGLASDLLREAPRGLLLVARARPAPAPARRLQRLRRLVGRFHVRPATLPERSILRRVLRRRDFGGTAPRELLQAAVGLAPHDRAAWLWLFEAGIAEGDVAGAARALRQFRRRGNAAGAPSALARARLREARGDARGAVRIVRRAAQRWPRDATLARVAAALASAGDAGS